MESSRVRFGRTRVLGRAIHPCTARRCWRLRGAEPLDAIEHSLSIVQRSTALDGVRHETSSQGDITSVKGLDALMEDRFGLALPLRLCATGSLDIRACSTVMTVEEQNAGPQVDGLFVVAGEVLIETREQQLLDSCVPFGAAQRLGGSGFGTKRIVG